MIGNFIKKMLGMPTSEDLKDFADRGAVVIDVRTSGEFNSGHGKNAKNIPLDQIPNQVDKIKGMNKPIIVCCLSGGRSGQAAGILKNAGVEVINGGPWQNVKDL